MYRSLLNRSVTNKTIKGKTLGIVIALSNVGEQIAVVNPRENTFAGLPRTSLLQALGQWSARRKTTRVNEITRNGTRGKAREPVGIVLKALLRPLLF